MDDAALRELVPHVWLDFQQMDEFQRYPLIVTGGHGIYATTSDGRTLMDGISGAAVTSLGYGDAAVAEAMKDQIDRFLFWPPLHGTNEPALRFAAKLCELLPGDINRAFLLSGGSEATECAFKMARQYHAQTGNPGKYKVIGRYWGYHGSTMGALSASGVPDKRGFGPFLTGYLQAQAPYCYRCPFGHQGVGESCCLAGVEQIDQMIRYEGRETVSAVIVDPVMAAAGILVPSKAYYQRLREICDEHNVLLIFDEVLTGFGRLGTWFAADHYEVLPDIICVGKGVSSGFVPLAATAAREHVAAAFGGAPADGRQFLHGNTFGGNPLATATGLAVIEQLEKRGIVDNANIVGGYLGQQLHALAERQPYIGDVRGLGMLWGIEFVLDRETRDPFPPHRSLAPAVIRRALEKHDLILRSNRSILQVSPPLITTAAEVDELMTRLEASIDDSLTELGFEPGRAAVPTPA
jgi:taurine-pyruvate aminotransferase